MSSPELWLFGSLITVLIAVFSVIGGLLKVTYDISTQLHTAMYGDGENDGFLAQYRRNRNRLREDHEQVSQQLLIQGRLLTELTYSFAELAEELDDLDETDVDVDFDRIERLREMRDDEL